MDPNPVMLVVLDDSRSEDLYDDLANLKTAVWEYRGPARWRRIAERLGFDAIVPQLPFCGVWRREFAENQAGHVDASWTEKVDGFMRAEYARRMLRSRSSSR